MTVLVSSGELERPVDVGLCSRLVHLQMAGEIGAHTLEIVGPIDAKTREQCYELGATVAVTVAGDA